MRASVGSRPGPPGRARATGHQHAATTRPCSPTFANGQNRPMTDTADRTPLTCTDWQAWHDRMPGVEPTLHVTGECTCPTPGYAVELRVHEPQGINPGDLLLDLVVTPPTDPVPDVLSPCPVTFELQTTAKYDTVTIIDVEAGIPVKDVG